MTELNEAVFTKAFLNALSDSKVIQKLDESIGASLKFQIEELKSNQEQLKKDLKDLTEMNKSILAENERLRKSFKEKDEQIQNLEAALEKATYDIDSQEQYSRKNNIRITGITETANENILNCVLELFNTKLELQLRPEDIEKAHRSGTKGTQPRPIIVRFCSYATRDLVYRRRKKLKDKLSIDASMMTNVTNGATTQEPENATRNTTNETQNDLSTNGLGSPDKTNPNDHFSKLKNLVARVNDFDKMKIFINEDLTKLRADIFKNARVLKKDKKITDCWTWNCSILVKDNSNRIIKINNYHDLAKF